MDTPDPAAVREQAMRLDRNWYDEFDCTEEGLSRECIDAIRSVRDAYLTLTDPTPLTVEVLAGMGFTVKSAKLEVWLHEGGMLLAHKQDDGFSFSTSSMAYVWPNPRTAGELTQLLTRLEK